jgi:STE24 endopeptidase
MRLGYTTELAKSLIKLQIQNLSTMDADWMYASYHYSHPILAERLGAIGWASAKKGSVSKGADEHKPLKTADREL